MIAKGDTFKMSRHGWGWVLSHPVGEYTGTVVRISNHVVTLHITEGDCPNLLGAHTSTIAALTAVQATPPPAPTKKSKKYTAGTAVQPSTPTPEVASEDSGQEGSDG